MIYQEEVRDVHANAALPALASFLPVEDFLVSIVAHEVLHRFFGPHNSMEWDTGIMNGRDTLMISGPEEDMNRNGLDDDAENLTGIQIQWVQGRKRPG